MDYLLVHCSFPSDIEARQIGTEVVRRQLAACVSLCPAVTSIYRWKGEIEEAAEVLAVFKTTRAGFSALETAIRELHPYEVPEIVGVPIAEGSGGYLRWIDEQTREGA